MRKEYGQVLRKLFAKRMKETFPQFSEEKIKSVYFWPGDRAYRWTANETLKCWVVLSASKKDYDEFNVLIGWSKLGRYPELSMVPCVEHPSPERKEFERQEYLTRLPYLWTANDEWWGVKKFSPAQSVAEIQQSLEPIAAEVAHKAVAPLIEDAIAKLKQYALPYFDELRVKERVE